MADLPSPIELTALPPLSPTMERAFSEAFADMSELEKAVVKVEPLEATSPSPGPSAPNERLRNISPSEKKGVASFNDAAEAKRARRSAIEKKSRQRRQNILRRMREEVKQLERVYVELNQRREKDAMDELQSKYSELSLVVHALEEDQQRLQGLILSHESFQQTVRELEQQKEEVYDSGVPPSASFVAQLRQHSMAECYDIVRDSYAQIQRFARGGQYETTGASFMGWTDKRKYDETSKALQYGFTKKFPLEKPEELLMKTWNMFVDGPNMEQMSFSGRVSTRFEVLQALNDDLLITRRDHRLPDIPTTFATVQIIFRLQTPSGYTLCMRTIPAPEIENALEPHEYFYHVFHWTHFNRLYDEFGNPAGCEIVAAGSIADQRQLKSTYWLFELVCSILRWETSCVAPLFLKQI